jgi:hypothetical protein
MSWDTDLTTAISELIAEIQSLAAALAPIATSTSSSLPAVADTVLTNQFFKVYATGLTNGGTDITLALNGTTVFDFVTAFSGGSNVPFSLEMTLFYDGSNLYLMPLAPLNTNDLRPTKVTTSSPSTLTFSIGGTSGINQFILKLV